MLPERLQIFFRRFGRVYKVSVTCLLILLCTISLCYPVIASGSPASSQDPPTDCVDTPTYTGPIHQNATIAATIEQESGTPDVVNVTYEPLSDEWLRLGINFGKTIELVDSSGFTSSPGKSDLKWNRSAEEHWITYRMTNVKSNVKNESADSLSSVKPPYSNDSIIVTLPDHSTENVTIETAESGYIASNMAYIGEYTTASRTVGCQRFDLIIDEDRSRWFNAEDRLDNLETAAKAFPGGQKYETVTVFVTSEHLGEVGGFNYKQENSIVIKDHNYLSEPALTWIHEYIHTLQRPTVTDDMYWTIEASADYLSQKIALENGLISSVEYDSRLATGYTDYGSSSLNSSFRKDISYKRGGAVFAQIDSDLEGSETSIYDLFQWLYTPPDTSYNDLQTYLENDSNLSESTVKSYDGWVMSSEPLEHQYQNQWLSVIPPRVAASGSLLFFPVIRLGSLVLFPCMVYNLYLLLVKIFRLDPDFDW